MFPNRQAKSPTLALRVPEILPVEIKFTKLKHGRHTWEVSFLSLVVSTLVQAALVADSGEDEGSYLRRADTAGCRHIGMWISGAAGDRSEVWWWS